MSQDTRTQQQQQPESDDDDGFGDFASQEKTGAEGDRQQASLPLESKDNSQKSVEQNPPPNGAQHSLKNELFDFGFDEPVSQNHIQTTLQPQPDHLNVEPEMNSKVGHSVRPVDANQENPDGIQKELQDGPGTKADKLPEMGERKKPEEPVNEFDFDFDSFTPVNGGQDPQPSDQLSKNMQSEIQRESELQEKVLTEEQQKKIMETGAENCLENTLEGAGFGKITHPEESSDHGQNIQGQQFEAKQIDGKCINQFSAADAQEERPHSIDQQEQLDQQHNLQLSLQQNLQQSLQQNLQQQPEDIRESTASEKQGSAGNQAEQEKPKPTFEYHRTQPSPRDQNIQEGTQEEKGATIQQVENKQLGMMLQQQSHGDLGVEDVEQTRCENHPNTALCEQKIEDKIDSDNSIPVKENSAEQQYQQQQIITQGKIQLAEDVERLQSDSDSFDDYQSQPNLHNLGEKNDQLDPGQIKESSCNVQPELEQPQQRTAQAQKVDEECGGDQQKSRTVMTNNDVAVLQDDSSFEDFQGQQQEQPNQMQQADGSLQNADHFSPSGTENIVQSSTLSPKMNHNKENIGHEEQDEQKDSQDKDCTEQQLPNTLVGNQPAKELPNEINEADDFGDFEDTNQPAGTENQALHEIQASTNQPSNLQIEIEQAPQQVECEENYYPPQPETDFSITLREKNYIKFLDVTCRKKFSRPNTVHESTDQPLLDSFCVDMHQVVTKQLLLHLTVLHRDQLNEQLVLFIFTSQRENHENKQRAQGESDLGANQFFFLAHLTSYEDFLRKMQERGFQRKKYEQIGKMLRNLGKFHSQNTDKNRLSQTQLNSTQLSVYSQFLQQLKASWFKSNTKRRFEDLIKVTIDEVQTSGLEREQIQTKSQNLSVQTDLNGGGPQSGQLSQQLSSNCSDISQQDIANTNDFIQQNEVSRNQPFTEQGQLYELFQNQDFNISFNKSNSMPEKQEQGIEMPHQQLCEEPKAETLDQVDPPLQTPEQQSEAQVKGPDTNFPKISLSLNSEIIVSTQLPCKEEANAQNKKLLADVASYLSQIPDLSFLFSKTLVYPDQLLD